VKGYDAWVLTSQLPSQKLSSILCHGCKQYKR
jgi:hypothetical protein